MAINRPSTFARRVSPETVCLGLLGVMGAMAIASGGCGEPEYSRHGALAGGGGAGPDGGGAVGSGGTLGASGGAPGTGGTPASGGAGTASGGSGSGGATSTGGASASGGATSGGAPGTGGMGTGGAAGGTGGAATGGRGSGGAGTGGAATGGRGTGGAGTGGALADPARYSFETNVQGWMATGTTGFTSITRDTTHHYAGAASLAAALSASAASMHQMRVTPDPSIPAGATVTAHVYVPAGSTIEWLQLYLQEGAPNYTWTGTAATFTAGAWTTLTVTAPTSGGAITSVGLQLHLTGAWTGTFYVDSVSW